MKIEKKTDLFGSELITQKCGDARLIKTREKDTEHGQKSETSVQSEIIHADV